MKSLFFSLIFLTFFDFELLGQISLISEIQGQRKEFGQKVVLSDDGNKLIITSEYIDNQKLKEKLFIYALDDGKITKIDSLSNFSTNGHDVRYISTNTNGNFICTGIGIANFPISRSAVLVYKIEESYILVDSLNYETGIIGDCIKIDKSGNKIVSSVLSESKLRTYSFDSNSDEYILVSELKLKNEYLPRSFDLSDDGNYLIVYNEGFNKPYSGDVEFYQWEMDHWRLHSSIRNTALIKQFGNEVIINPDGTKCVFGISTDTGEIIRSYERIGDTWKQYGNDVILSDCFIIDYGLQGITLDISSDGETFCVSPECVSDVHDAFRVFTLKNNGWNEAKGFIYDKTKYRPENCANISDDGKTIIARYVGINNDPTIFDYIAVYQLDKSVDTEDTYDKWIIFPNPTQDYLSISDGQALYSTIEIYTIDGKLIIQNPIIENNKINVSSLVEGMYIIKFKDKLHIRSFKFIKE